MNILHTSLALILLLTACSQPRNAQIGEHTRDIRGGNPTPGNQFDDIVELRSRSLPTDVEKNAVCSGTIVAPRVVFTAAHCVASFAAVPSEGEMIDPNGERTQYSQILVFPGYNLADNIGSPDLALIILSDESYQLNFRSFNTTGLNEGAFYDAVGFGENGLPQGISQRLEGEYEFTEYKDGVDVNGVTVKDALLEFDPGRTDEIACQGDSGGPVLGSGQSIAGIASYVTFEREYSCNNVTSATYVSVTPFLDWIDENIRRFSPDNECVVDDLFVSMDGGCKNSVTGKVWSRQVVRKDGQSKFNWNQASQFCDALKESGQADWQLPTPSELTEMLSFGGQSYLRFESGPFAFQTYWTRSRTGADARYVNFSNSSVQTDSTGSEHYLICVRG